LGVRLFTRGFVLVQGFKIAECFWIKPNKHTHKGFLPFNAVENYIFATNHSTLEDAWAMAGEDSHHWRRSNVIMRPVHNSGKVLRNDGSVANEHEKPADLGVEFYDRHLGKGARVADLCCGAGGFSAGLIIAGASEVFAVDSDASQVEGFKSHMNALAINLEREDDDVPTALERLVRDNVARYYHAPWQPAAGNVATFQPGDLTGAEDTPILLDAAAPTPGAVTATSAVPGTRVCDPNAETQAGSDNEVDTHLVPESPLVGR
jgi:hypothetical protein